jgi:hypothetical protein
VTLLDPARLEERRRAILAHETAVASSVASRVVDKPVLSAWMILIPLLFLHYLQRQRVFRQGVRGVADALLRTRRRALEIACSGAGGGSGAHEREPACGEDDDRIRALHAAQQVEIDLLARHYRRLLAAQGDDYRALVRNAYGDDGAYRHMIETLRAAEAQLEAAALKARRDADGRAELFMRLERARADARMAELRLLYD